MRSSETFESELTQLLPRLRRFAFALSRNGADADDLAQTTVERALRSRDQWQPGTRLDSWLYRIMRNLWIDTVRARGRRDRHEAPEVAAKDVGEDPREAMHASMELQRAMSAMERLPDEQRMAIALVLVEGLSYRDAAGALDVPIGTLTSRLARGREALQALLGDGAAE